MTARTVVSSTFAALRYPNYRLWFYGQLFSLVGTWMQATAQGFLVFELTNSAAYLGYVSFINGVPTWLFTLYGGVIADRIPRRTLLVVTQTAMMLLAFVLGALAFSGSVQAWHILVLSFLLGVANAFDAPARQSFTIELVEREHLGNAISLNAAMFTTANIAGPAFGGLLYAWIGPGWCFMLNGASFIAVITALVMMRLAAFTPLSRTKVFDGIREGISYVRHSPLVVLLMTTVGMASFFAFSLLNLVPAWAVNVLGGDSRTSGFLLAARGAGALGGALVLAAISGRNYRGRIWLIASFLMSFGLFGFSMSRELYSSLALLAVVGWSMISLVNNSNALIQTHIPDALRGRVMGIYTLIFIGSAPLGSLFSGWLAEYLGEPVAVQINAGFLLLFSLWVLVWHPEVRRLQ